MAPLQEYAENGTGGTSEGAHRKVRFPRFPKAKGKSSSSSRASGPIVHEACAQNMFKARAERAQVGAFFVAYYFE